MLKCYVELTWTESFQLLYVALTKSANDDWFVEYIKITSKRESKTWVANYNMWITKSKYKVHGNYGPLYEIVTAGLELESEVELYFSADNNMAEQSRTRWNRT